LELIYTIARMKYFKIASVFIFSILFTTIYSCNNEPLDSDLQENSEQSSGCVSVTSALQIASANFSASTNDNYTQVCNEYKIALQNKIDSCGDSSGNLESTITSLGDCSTNNTCTVTSNSASFAESDYNSDNTDTDLCNAFKSALQNKITACGDASGEIQSEIDGLGDCM